MQIESALAPIPSNIFTNVLAKLCRARELIEEAAQNKDLETLLQIKIQIKAVEIAAKSADGLLITRKESHDMDNNPSHFVPA
jgi:hypothetical protein